MTSSIPQKQPWHIQCVNSLSSDTSPSLMVVFPDARYLFDCGENTTRALVQDRISIRKLKNVFLSSSTQIQSTSGLGGLLLSLGDKEGTEISVFGPHGLDHLIASMRYHTRRPKMQVKVHALPQDHMSDQNIYEDANIKVQAFPALPRSYHSGSQNFNSNGKRRSISRSPSPPSKRLPPVNMQDESVSHGVTTRGVDATRQSQTPVANPSAEEMDWWARDFQPSTLGGVDAKTWRGMVIRDMFRGGASRRPSPAVTADGAQSRPRSSPAWNASRLPAISTLPIAVSYRLTGPATRGKFDPAAAVEQGVKPGPDFAILSRGEAVTLPDGSVVLPETCLEAGSLPPTLAIVHCPESEYIDHVTASGLETASPKTDYRTAFHILGAGVVRDERYRAWMAAFPSGTEHVVSCPELSSDPITFASAAILQVRLAKLDQEMFKIPHYNLSSDDSLLKSLGAKALRMGENRAMNGSLANGNNARQRNFDFLPDSAEAGEAASKLNDRTEQGIAHSKEAWAEYQSLAAEACGTVQQESSAREASHSAFAGQDIRVTPLGTGSALPSKYRNVSSTHLELPTGQGVLLDVGEGTLGQLRRFHGPGLQGTLARLQLVFISHMHADHHTGLAELLAARAKVPDSEQLWIACPPQVRTYLLDLSHLINLPLHSGSGVAFIDNNALSDGRDQAQSATRQLCQALDLSGVTAVPVQHRARCFGLVLSGNSGWKVVYSGDTQPCEALVRAGQEATLLIHEATIEDEKPEVARAKGHSTFAEALDVAKRTRARHCLLTHFSQRYPKFPPLADRSEPEQDGSTCEVAVAFDLMSLKIGEFWKMKHYIKPLQVLFSEWEGDDTPEETALLPDAAAVAKSDDRLAMSKKEKKKKEPKTKTNQDAKQKKAKQDEKGMEAQ